MNDIARMSKEVMQDDIDLDIIITLSHQDLTFEELTDVMEKNPETVLKSLNSLISRGIVVQDKERYKIEGLYGV
jgi:ArsR family transcriptional regulator